MGFQTNIIFCTSLNQKILNDYGKQTLDSMLENISPTYKISLFSEDNLNLNIPEIDFYNLFEFRADYEKFVVKHQKNPRINNNNVKQYKKEYVKFSFKVFSMCAASRIYSNYDFLIWIDSDIFIKKIIDKNIINYLCDKGNFASYLNRENVQGTTLWNKDHTETGLISFNLNHKIKNNFFYNFENIYLNEIIFKLIAWDDTSVFDFIKDEYEKKLDIKFRKLTDGTSRNPINDHLMLRDYFFHPMGNKKVY